MGIAIAVVIAIIVFACGCCLVMSGKQSDNEEKYEGMK